MTETPKQPDDRTHRGRAEDRPVRRPTRQPLVAQSEPGFLDTFKESFASTKAVKAASPEVQKARHRRSPRDALRQQGPGHRADPRAHPAGRRHPEGEGPELVEEYKQVVLQSVKDVAAAADDTSAEGDRRRRRDRACPHRLIPAACRAARSHRASSLRGAALATVVQPLLRLTEEGQAGRVLVRGASRRGGRSSGPSPP